MWYFSWILGLGLVSAFAILNAAWFELDADRQARTQPAEYAAERIQGALLYPLSTFNAGLLPPDGTRRVVFHCAGGKRSLAAAEQRVAAGSTHAAHMGGGIAAWKAAGLPVIAPGT